MKQTTYGAIALLSVIWLCGSINASERIGLGQAVIQLMAGGIVFFWAFVKGELWEIDEEGETKHETRKK